MSQQRSLELKLLCHIYIPIKDESEAQKKRDQFDKLIEDNNLDWQVHKEEVQDIT